MLNSYEEIKRNWPGSSLDLDDEVKNSDNKTKYDLFIDKGASEIKRRLVKWVGREAYDDASSPSPSDADRKASLIEAEFSLFNVIFIEKLFSDNASGLVKDTQIPSGMRTSFNILTEEGYMQAIEHWTGKAYRAVMEYVP